MSAQKSFSILSQIQRETLRLTRPYVLIGIVMMSMTSAGELVRGHTTPWIISEPIVASLMAIVLLVVKDTWHQARAICLGCVALSTAGLLHFGPMLGTGLLFALSILAVSFFFGRREMAGTLAYLLLLMGGVALASSSGWHPTWWLAVISIGDWLRLIVGGGLMLGALGMLFKRIHQAMLDAIANEIAAGIKQRAAEEERERALIAGMTSQRLETLGQLAGGVAHDINNTLMVIQGTFDALADAAAADRSILLEEGSTAVRNASQTVRRLLGLARRSTEEVGSCDPVVVIETGVRAFRRILSGGLVIEIDAHAGTRAKISEASFEQILLNLLVNARDATKGQGIISISCKRVDHRVCITIADDGPGMTAEVRSRAFEPFFTTKPRGEGTGLGLALVQRLVHNASGTVELVTSPGHGVRFEISLPIDDETTPIVNDLEDVVKISAVQDIVRNDPAMKDPTVKDATIPTAPEVTPTTTTATTPPPIAVARTKTPGPAVSRTRTPNLAVARTATPTGARILVVEDDAQVSRLLQRILRKRNYQVVIVGSIDEARPHLELPSFELLITDGQLPDGNANSAIALFRNHHRQAPVIVCTGFLDDDATIRQIEQGGLVRVMHKPFETDKLLGMVNQVLEPSEAERMTTR